MRHLPNFKSPYFHMSQEVCDKVTSAGLALLKEYQGLYDPAQVEYTRLQTACWTGALMAGQPDNRKADVMTLLATCEAGDLESFYDCVVEGFAKASLFSFGRSLSFMEIQHMTLRNLAYIHEERAHRRGTPPLDYYYRQLAFLGWHLVAWDVVQSEEPSQLKPQFRLP